MSVSKIWGLAAGLFIVSILASTLQLSAAMPNSANVAKAQMQSDMVGQRTITKSRQDHSPTAHIPMVNVGCALPQGGAHLIAQCAILASAK
ncbi:MAG: hypothetical protein ACJAR9_000725 [Celeribacter sp.]|jgi:hypothetical protein